MKKGKVKKILLICLSTFVFLVAVLAVHIYIVTRPKAPDANTRVMARIDFKDHLQQQDANKITAWLYNQKGVDHVLCNQKTGIAVFTYYAVKTNANKIVSDMRAALPYNATRIVPTKEQMQSGCPAASGSLAMKITNLFN